MPLDLKKVITQIKNLEGQDSKDSNQNRLDSTYKLFQSAKENNEKLIRKVLETNSTGKSNFYFAVPDPKEDISKTFESKKDFSTPHITIASDGSQVNPSAHEFTSACLINTGLVAIPYFNKNTPVVLSSEPVTYNSTEDISPDTEGIQEEDLISYERTLKEIEDLVKLAKKYTEYKIPIVALLDGTLIHWHIEKFNSVFISKFIERFSNAMYELKSLEIPIASFLSNSRSNDLINMLKIYKCPYESVDCKKHCSNINSKSLPCNPTLDYKPVLDRRVIEKYFVDLKSPPGTRTALFKSNSKILNLYNEDLKIYFFYINTGREIARVELPSYVANNPSLLEIIHNAISLQCKVGFGYPIVLSEAHLQAVVTKKDRDIFYDLIKDHSLKRNSKIQISNKELKKRISFV